MLLILTKLTLCRVILLHYAFVLYYPLRDEEGLNPMPDNYIYSRTKSVV